jgi:hypothetical protein
MATKRARKIEPAAEPIGRCKDCRWAEFKEVIYCHLEPPKPIYDVSEGFVDSYRPVVSPDGYCAQFAPHLSS